MRLFINSSLTTIGAPLAMYLGMAARTVINISHAYHTLFAEVVQYGKKYLGI